MFYRKIIGPNAQFSMLKQAVYIVSTVLERANKKQQMLVVLGTNRIIADLKNSNTETWGKNSSLRISGMVNTGAEVRSCSNKMA
jgi:hypothetical protein